MLNARQATADSFFPQQRRWCNTGPIGIIDIGSNSIRLVVYDQLTRTPRILFNEKVAAQLGRNIPINGNIDDEAIARALDGLKRFWELSKAMKLSSLRTVATAAIRDAENGNVVLEAIKAIGLKVEVLSGEEEGQGSGYGVISAMPDANGIVGDLGGGSLELIRIENGKVGERISFPFGVLRIADIRKKNRNALDRAVAEAFKKASWLKEAKNLPFYMVGGAWRSLTRLDLYATRYPIPVLHNYIMGRDRPTKLLRIIQRHNPKKLRNKAGISSSRIGQLSDAAALLSVVSRQLNSKHLVTSVYGLREGLLYLGLDKETQKLDPLIWSANQRGEASGRFYQQGETLYNWMTPLFIDELPAYHRLRHAACLLADTAWQINPDFRAEQILSIILHGRWVGLDARGRALIGEALATSYDGTMDKKVVNNLLTEEDRIRAFRWGKAIRLGMRLSAGVTSTLKESRIIRRDNQVILQFYGNHRLNGETVGRRLKALAHSFNATEAVEFF
ncbi:Ppx/GppA family phosphatase [Zymomonas mobilis]|uniref:Ppx/GppA phosphatase n=1 Tax=Zymomonas mobilis subsp. pomaceae (strain ATCC 29192 / DSM 22645 / JCM 10191 / CCUG 17912 / NBRC 13757 / NCIMB 11200 / NRRL B-4491 / Barker I) TaxID=579138 RepID=F8EVV0_ZYMMT|nr:Ppx/GppA family phosphatase [Zymomonas mobilis]AEI37427.1 Ppx/GppA phosphatase [Zymomonas mobilis subsp. pomaceae ATCC 29192]MDX5948794.1 Ppx/GppA family phosphatase [Zymomonas mobilis subsp. pomaceae]GEB88602.1 exopolyphosphatase [Zymomonas mobilis subsp. pomaceae]